MASAEEHSGRSIQQTAGDGSTQIGEVHGNVYIGSSASEAEVSLNLDAYREHQLSQLAIWERQYTRLDVDPAVALAGQDLRPVPDSRLALTEAFIRHERLVVVGGAGSGKTTSMLYLVASVLPGGYLMESFTGLVPVYIELGRFRADSSTSPLDHLLLLIAETLFRGKACPEPPSLRGLRQLLASNLFLFLLDGLNEAHASLRASCLTAIADLAKLYPGHRIVLSSRPHGFSPPQGWDIALLRELEDAQIPEFVERYTQEKVSQPLLQTVLEAHNPLLRVPLFLSLLVRMSGSPLPDLQRRLRSRSGLIAQYVEFLLQRDLSSPADILSLGRLRDALDRLAGLSQTSGQVLPLADAKKTVEASTPGYPEEAGRILDNLCERGLLATDGQNLRFWHHTLQEYFYAGSVVRRWRGSKKQVGEMPKSLRRLTAKAEEEEALSFMVAHLRDEEAEAALRHELPINPALAISWADDLGLEGRAVAATQLFPVRIHSFALAARRYSLLCYRQRSALLPLCILGLAWSGFVFVVFASFGFLTSCIMFLGFFPFLDALFRCPSAEKLQAALLVIPEIRDKYLRRRLGAVARDISVSLIASPSLRRLAQGISIMGPISAAGLVDLLRASDSLCATTRLIGYLNTPLAVPLLQEVLAYNNFLSLAALEALALRAARLREEHPRLKNLFWTVWRNDAMDCRIRRRARAFLLDAGEHPGGRVFLFKYFVLRPVKFLLLGLGLAMIGAIGLIPAALDQTFPIILLIIFFCFAVLIGRDARRIGARKISGSPPSESGEPWQWGLGAFLFPCLLIPLYLLNRQRIRRNAVPFDWTALSQVLKAEGHGDNRSIAHPLSAPSARR